MFLLLTFCIISKHKWKKLLQSDNESLLTAFEAVYLDSPSSFHINGIATFSTPISFRAADDYIYLNNQLFPGTIFDNTSCSLGLYTDHQVTL